jgi:hypothetical protein
VPGTTLPGAGLVTELDVTETTPRVFISTHTCRTGSQRMTSGRRAADSVMLPAVQHVIMHVMR